MFNKSYFRRLSLAALIIMVFTAIAPAADAPPERVVVVPFTINADKDLTFLQKGIADMLTSRLASETVEVVNREETQAALGTASGPMTDKGAREIGNRLNAQHVLFGSLTVFGESVSIDAKMIDVSGEKNPVAFFTQAQGMGEVIPKINTFAAEINEKAFNRTLTAYAPAPAPARVSTTLPATDVRAHPEKLMQEPGLYGGKNALPWQQAAAGSEGVPNPAFIPAQGASTGGAYWKSRNFNRSIIGMAMGDVNGDDLQEVVLVEEHAAHIYVFEAGRLVKTGELVRDNQRFFVGIDIADINGNGTPEIFLSALNAFRNTLASSVMEFDGQGFQTVVKGSPWFYRVSHYPGGEGAATLIGQRSRRDSPFDDDIYTLQWENKEYTSSRKLIAKKKKANALGCAYGDLFNQERNVAVAYSASDVIRVFSTASEVGHTADDNYGGTLIDFTLAKTDNVSVREFVYLPARLVIDDVDGDGQNELVTVRNFDIARKKLDSMRKFTKGQLVALSWGGLGLNEAWSTPKMDSLVSDFVIGDLDNDGRRDLVAALIVKPGRAMFSKSVSALVAYPLSM